VLQLFGLTRELGSRSQNHVCGRADLTGRIRHTSNIVELSLSAVGSLLDAACNFVG
jgi:hypothetical protein